MPCPRLVIAVRPHDPERSLLSSYAKLWHCSLAEATLRLALIGTEHFSSQPVQTHSAYDVAQEV
jgi:hypothetical protein